MLKQKNLSKWDVIVIGGGPAGIMAAAQAGNRGKTVLLIEKNNRMGKKLLISGKGRCNLTNSDNVEEFLSKFSKSGRFLRNSFARFFNTELMDFFTDCGVPLKTERGGRVFPQSDLSRDILSALCEYLKKSNVTIMYNKEVKRISPVNSDNIKVHLNNSEELAATRVIIATGGSSYPATGSTGDGFRFASELGHTVVEEKPALVPVELKESFIKKWQGVSLKNVSVTVLKEKKKISDRFGEMLFTHFGVSGPIILDLSADIYDALSETADVYISINFKPALSTEQIDKRLLREFENAPSKSIKNIMYSLLPKGLVSEFLKYCSIDENTKANQMNKQTRKTLVNGLSDFKLRVRAVRPVSEAIVTRGGVKTSEIDPKTMESKKVPGIYFAGEVIDIDAKTGGYNMQAAFSTGWIAGNNV